MVVEVANSFIFLYNTFKSTYINNYENPKYSIKKINITVLLDKVDQSQITSETIRNLFDLKPDEKANTPYIDLPGIKVLVIPTQRKEITVEPNRLMVSDSNDDLTKSKIVNDFKKVYDEFRGKSKLRAYGFNYDILLFTQENFQYSRLLSANLKKLLNEGMLKEAGARVVYDKGGRRIDIQVVPGGQPNQLGIHANVHHESNTINFTNLHKELLADYREINQAIQRFIG